jgi:hypothetical protein
MVDIKHKGPGHRHGGRQHPHMLPAKAAKLGGLPRHESPQRRGIGVGEHVLSATDEKILERRLNRQQQIGKIY